MPKTNTVQASKKRDIRGTILRALATGGMRPLSNRSLANALAGVTTDIYEHLLYLADKGYIRVESLDENPLSCLEYTVVLTAKGIDLLDGSIRDDPGIVI